MAKTDIPASLIGTKRKYTYKNGKGYAIYEFINSSTVTRSSYDNNNTSEGKSYTYSYRYTPPELKITWKTSFDTYEVTPNKILGKSKPIILEKIEGTPPTYSTSPSQSKTPQ